MTGQQLDTSREGQPLISMMSTHALLFEAPGEFDLIHQRRIWALVKMAAQWPGVREAIPGITNLMLLFDEPPTDILAVRERLLEAWEAGTELPIEGRTFDIPVIYGGKGGPHLHEVAESLETSIDAVVELHTAQLYTVYAIGSHAGLGYLGGLDAKLFLPRRAVPLQSIPGGSVSIAGMQTAVSASAGPSGWHTIGFADIAFFDPNRSSPALLQPGDRIRFNAEEVIR